MKRLLIAVFLIICSFSIMAITSKKAATTECSEKVCCLKKCDPKVKTVPKTDYIFWEPIGRLMVIHQ